MDTLVKINSGNATQASGRGLQIKANDLTLSIYKPLAVKAAYRPVAGPSTAG